MNPNFLRSAEFYKKRYHNFATLLIIPISCLIVFTITFLFFAKKEITVASTGEVTPSSIVSVIQSTSESSIIKNNITDNMAVKKGDVLMTYSEEASPERQSEQDTIVRERQEREAKEEKSKNKKERNKKKSKSKKRDDAKSNDETETRNISIFAPEDGIIHTDTQYEGQNLIPVGSEVAQLYPEIKKGEKVQLTYYVSTDDVVSMRKGQVARLSLERKGNEKLVLKGKITTVASSSTATKKGNLFKITAEVKLSKKEAQLVKYGMMGKTVTVVAEKTYFNYFKDKLLHKMTS